MSGILYSTIARDDVLLVSSQKISGNFETMVLSMLPNISTHRNTKTSYTSNDYMYHVLVEDGLVYICATNVEFGRRLPYAYLIEIKRRFSNSSLIARARYASERELDRDFGPVMEEQMIRFSTGEGDQVMQLQSQVDGVMGIMTQNIEKIIERGDKIDDLLNKTEELGVSSMQFHSTSRQVRRKMVCKNVKMWIICGIIFSVILTLIILMATNVIPVKNL
ncbi:vesicle-associated membrane protein 7-like [Centruroides vittatus]|uniref:vesicle-associated membrane protein 7-like n=1 Tax=Centruroides vittatus TaxID=120091 RepID=UPI0035109EFE